MRCRSRYGKVAKTSSTNMRQAVVPRPCMWSHLLTGSPDWPPPRLRFARCAMWRYASSHTCRRSAAASPSNSPPSATAEADSGGVELWPGPPTKIGSRPSRTPADEQDHDHGAGGHQQTDHEHPEAGPDRPGQLDPGVRLDVDPPGCVGIHHDRGPATELGIPRKRLLARALGLGDPEVLIARR